MEEMEEELKCPVCGSFIASPSSYPALTIYVRRAPAACILVQTPESKSPQVTGLGLRVSDYDYLDLDKMSLYSEAVGNCKLLRGFASAPTTPCQKSPNGVRVFPPGYAAIATICHRPWPLCLTTPVSPPPMPPQPHLGRPGAPRLPQEPRPGR